MVTLAILSIVLASAAPGFGRLVSNHRATAAIDDLAHDIALARAEALRRNRRVYLAPLSAHWRDGWAVFADRNDNRIYDVADELVARHDPLPDSVAITNPNNPNREPFTDVGSPQRTYILFDGSGYPRQRNGALNIGSLVVTDRTGGATTVRTLCLASFGRVRIVVDHAGCS